MTGFLAEKLSRSVLFQGGYDCRNAGDDAFAAICVWGAKTFWQTESVAFLKSKLPQMPVPVRTVLSGQGTSGLRTRLEMAHQIAMHPVLIFGGGSVFFKAGGGVWKLCRMLSRMKRLEVGAIGVSLGPYPDTRAREAVRETLKHFSFLVLRDTSSYQDALAMDLPYAPVEGFDLAAMLPQVYTVPARPSGRTRPVVGVSICHYERYVNGDPARERRREAALLEGLKILAGQMEVDFHLLVFNGNEQKGDREISEWIAGRLSEETSSEVKLIAYSEDPRQMWSHIANCDVMVSTRLHAGIFSYMAGVPFVQVEYHKKCTDFLDVTGYPAAYRLGDMEASPREMAEYVAQLLTKKELRYGRDQQELVRRSELNFRFAAAGSSVGEKIRSV